MTDNEIIKALECCGQNILYEHCIDCPFNGELSKAICTIYLSRDALNLIKRLKEEIERLKAEDEMAEGYARALIEKTEEEVEVAKAEAVKEFAEKLKKEAWSGYIMTGNSMCPANCLVTDADIDKMLKKWVGENNES